MKQEALFFNGASLNHQSGSGSHKASILSSPVMGEQIAYLFCPNPARVFLSILPILHQFQLSFLPLVAPT
jgi:hypothetical protein